MCRHEEGIVDGRRQEVDDPFISGRAPRGGGMIMALVDDACDLLFDCCNYETLVVILFTVLFAIYVEILSTRHMYLGAQLPRRV